MGTLIDIADNLPRWCSLRDNLGLKDHGSDALLASLLLDCWHEHYIIQPASAVTDEPGEEHTILLQEKQQVVEQTDATLHSILAAAGDATQISVIAGEGNVIACEGDVIQTNIIQTDEVALCPETGDIPEESAQYIVTSDVIDHNDVIATTDDIINTHIDVKIVSPGVTPKRAPVKRMVNNEAFAKLADKILSAKTEEDSVAVHVVGSHTIPRPGLDNGTEGKPPPSVKLHVIRSGQDDSVTAVPAAGSSDSQAATPDSSELPTPEPQQTTESSQTSEAAPATQGTESQTSPSKNTSPGNKSKNLAVKKEILSDEEEEEKESQEDNIVSDEGATSCEPASSILLSVCTPATDAVRTRAPKVKQESVEEDVSSSPYGLRRNRKPTEKLRALQSEMSPDREQFTCAVCSRVFASKTTLANHLEKHWCQQSRAKLDEFAQEADSFSVKKEPGSTKEVFMCKICCVIFRDEKEIGEHKKSHGKLPYKCSKCEKEFRFIKHFMAHMNQKHDIAQPFECTQCQRKYRRVEDLAEHSLRVHHREFPHECGECGEGFTTTTRLRKHFRKEHAQSSSDTKRQLDQDDSDNPADTGVKRRKRQVFICPHCLKNCENATTLREHKAEHGPEPFTCQECLQKFIYEAAFVRHCEEEHNNLQPFTCSVCKASYQKTHHLIEHHLAFHAEELLYRCPECDVGFRTSNQLRSHRELGHDPETPIRKRQQVKVVPTKRRRNVYTCAVCCQNFPDAESLSHHRRTHGKFPFTCGVCAEKFRFSKGYKNHMQGAHGITQPFQCGDCGNTYAWISGLSEHQRLAHTLEKPYPCSLCEESFPSAHLRHVHEQEVHIQPAPIGDNQPQSGPIEEQLIENQPEADMTSGQKPGILKPGDVTIRGAPTIKRQKSKRKVFMCGFCCKYFPDEIKLREHKPTHGSHPFQCSLCPEKFRFSKRYGEHMVNVHEVARPFRCGDCNKTYSKISHLADHRRLFHTFEALYPCSRCDKSFMTSHFRREHEVSAHPEARSYDCAQCGVKYAKPCLLRDHIAAAHGTDLPHVCEICGRGFPTSSNLSVHLRTHDAYKKECPVCGKLVSNLKDHLAKHGTACPYVCEICGKGMKTKRDFRDHMRQHDEQTEFICSECGVKCVGKKALRIHSLEHQGRNPFMCEVCHQVYPSHASLVSHRRKHKTMTIQIEQLLD